ncbi:MAG TPA: nucleotide exchange factor GrpE [Terriglobales bacterium]|jgi:molecular chaperone GrpE|nr:nucleotide exchange factor GrpE [Terriglobales bacterium]
MGKGNGKSELDLENLGVSDERPQDNSSEEKAEAGARENQASTVTRGEDELSQLRAERDVLYDRVARQQADFENYRKRLQKEQSEHREYALVDALKALLPILDSFDRALEAHAGEEQFRGIELINRQFHDVLAKLGLRAIPATGEPFDPHLHQAIEVVETTEVPDNHIIEELQRGYKLKNRLLRPAMVRVARNPKK